MAVIAAAASATYKVTDHWIVGGEGGWDHLAVDESTHRLYVSHGTVLVVLDSNSGARVGQIPNTPDIHGIALASERGLGFSSNGGDNTVTAFDLKTLSIRKKIKVGENPDAILYEPTANVVITFNRRGRSATVVSVDGLTEMNSVPLGSRPEFAVTDGKGTVWVNLQDRNAVARLSGAPLQVQRTWPLGGCEQPSGLALDEKNRRIFSLCANRTMAVLDADSGRQITKLPIGAGADGVVFDPMTMNVLVAAGADGVVNVIHEASPESFTVAGSIAATRGARTIGIDAKNSRVFVPCADTSTPAKFQVLVLSRR